MQSSTTSLAPCAFREEAEEFIQNRIHARGAIPNEIHGTSTLSRNAGSVREEVSLDRSLADAWPVAVGVITKWDQHAVLVEGGVLCLSPARGCTVGNITTKRRRRIRKSFINKNDMRRQDGVPPCRAGLRLSHATASWTCLAFKKDYTALP